MYGIRGEKKEMSYSTSSNEGWPTEVHYPRSLKYIILIVIIAVIAVIGFFTFVVGVGVGEAMLIEDPLTRTVSDVVAVGPAWAVKMPWQRAIIIYYATDTFEQTVSCFSKDQLEMGVQLLIRWSLEQRNVRELFMKYPHLHYKEKAIESITEETIRLITKEYTAVDTIIYRDIVTLRIQEAVFDAIKREPSLANALTSLEFDLKEITYPERYKAAIDAKLVSEQQKMQAEFEKERTIINANATAQKLILEATGEKQSKSIRAEGTKTAIQRIMESAGIEESEELASLYIYLEALKQIAPNVDVLVVSSDEGGVPMIYQLPKKEGPGG
ncbi:MAG: hypothetical protein GTN80_04605 [Nitrososphaeria archaeon]|nr:hypothetical protein [Nitrososphaeria archaeon]NIQ32909.1 hypothetical protein [Nitrososphaeria archaeon]